MWERVKLWRKDRGVEEGDSPFNILNNQKYLKSELKSSSFDVYIGIKISFFGVLITIGSGLSILQLVTLNRLISCKLVDIFERQQQTQSKYRWLCQNFFEHVKQTGNNWFRNSRVLCRKYCCRIYGYFFKNERFWSLLNVTIFRMKEKLAHFTYLILEACFFCHLRYCHLASFHVHIFKHQLC